MKNTVELNLVMKNLKELYTKQQQIKEAVSALEGELKEYMTDKHIENLTLAEGSCSYKEVLSKVMNMKAFRQAHEAIYQEFAQEKLSMRFKLA